MAAARRLIAVVATACALLAGCSWGSEEPGLFPEHPVPPSTSASAPAGTAPALPVAGEIVWTTAEGLGVTVRLAVHAVRRMPGATVLDWSVTPLSARGYRTGDELPLVDLGLSRQTGGDVSAWLLDPSGRHAYRPLAHRSQRLYHRCLCTPLWVVQHNLVLGTTRLLQLTFPELPRTVRFVDVDLLNSAPIAHVPVMPDGEVPTAVGRTDLARPAPTSAPLVPPRQVRVGVPAQRQSIEVDQVTATPHGVAVTWALRALSDRPGTLADGPPVTDPTELGLQIVNQAPADGLKLVMVDGRRLHTLPVRWMTASDNGRPAYECLCSELDLWASALRKTGGAATVTTNYAAPPAGTRYVDLALPGWGAFEGLRLGSAPDAAARLGPSVAAPVDFWTYNGDQPASGWPVADWPTPVPDPAQLLDYRAVTEQLLTLPR